MICRFFKSFNMKINLILPYLLFLFTISSCHKEIKSDKGGIDIISNVYFDASKGLGKMQSFHVSKLNYSKNELIEEVPDLSFPEMSKQMYYIRDSLCYPFDLVESNLIFLTFLRRGSLFWFGTRKRGLCFQKSGFLIIETEEIYLIRSYFRRSTGALRLIPLDLYKILYLSN